MDYRELEERLRKARSTSRDAVADLLLAAEEAIRQQRLANMALHRRTQEAEAKTSESAELAKLRARAAHDRLSSQYNFNRMMNAHAEIKRIYEEIRRARADGCDDYGYHSVMDWRQDGGPMEPGTVWANRYISRKGGVVSVRPAFVIREMIDELLDLRNAAAQQRAAS